MGNPMVLRIPIKEDGSAGEPRTLSSGYSLLDGIRTAKHTVDRGREASLEIVRPVSASGSKLWV